MANWLITTQEISKNRLATKLTVEEMWFEKLGQEVLLGGEWIFKPWLVFV
jgi:hypothetical protein